MYVYTPPKVHPQNNTKHKTKHTCIHNHPTQSFEMLVPSVLPLLIKYFLKLMLDMPACLSHTHRTCSHPGEYRRLLRLVYQYRLLQLMKKETINNEQINSYNRLLLTRGPRARDDDSDDDDASSRREEAMSCTGLHCCGCWS